MALKWRLRWLPPHVFAREARKDPLRLLCRSPAAGMGMLHIWVFIHRRRNEHNDAIHSVHTHALLHKHNLALQLQQQQLQQHHDLTLQQYQQYQHRLQLALLHQLEKDHERELALQTHLRHEQPIVLQQQLQIKSLVQLQHQAQREVDLLRHQKLLHERDIASQQQLQLQLHLQIQQQQRQLPTPKQPSAVQQQLGRAGDVAL